MTYQQTVTLYPAGGKEGDLASMEPRHAVMPPQDYFRAGKDGIMQARFCWRDADNEGIVNNTGTGAPLGFVLNEGRGTIPAGQNASLYVLPGESVGVWSAVDAWVITSTAAKVGDKILASTKDGSISTGTAGADTVETGFVAASAGAAKTLIKITRFGV